MNARTVIIALAIVAVVAAVMISGGGGKKSSTTATNATGNAPAGSPASSLWGRLLNYEADKDYVAQDNPSLARTPLVIAMWEPLARALGWPKKPVGWAEVLKLATSRGGWADYGHPEYGRFKLGH